MGNVDTVEEAWVGRRTPMENKSFFEVVLLSYILRPA
jgi:hypothetical protein